VIVLAGISSSNGVTFGGRRAPNGRMSQGCSYDRRMITPDDKDWTWVLERPCGDCGFDASAITGPDVPALIRRDAQDWQRLLAAGDIRAGRTDPEAWSSLEYACHVRDVFERFHVRMTLMLTEDDPLFPNWDQDVTAVEDRYDEQDPAEVVAALAVGAEQVAVLLEGLTADQWSRPGRRSDGASFTLETISRYLIHDPVHHVWDVEHAG
jgi:hypothetical protein